MNYVKTSFEYLVIGGKPLVLDWSGFPEAVYFRAQNLIVEGVYSGGVLELTRSETVGKYECSVGGLYLCGVYTTATYGGADGMAIGWAFVLRQSGEDAFVAIRFFNVTAANTGISPAGLYARVPIYSSVPAAPPYEILV